jgi:hypothetical protein
MRRGAAAIHAKSTVDSTAAMYTAPRRSASATAHNRSYRVVAPRKRAESGYLTLTGGRGGHRPGDAACGAAGRCEARWTDPGTGHRGLGGGPPVDGLRHDVAVRPLREAGWKT